MRNQTLVAVGAWVGDGVQRTCVLDDAANVVQGKVRQSGVATACKQVFAIFPDGLVHVHARAVVTVVGLGHERRRFAVHVGHVLDDVLLQQRPVGTFHQSRELGADFTLASTCYFVVVHFNWNAHGFEDLAHLVAHVDGAVHWGDREVATLGAWTVSAVAAFQLGSAVPRCFVFVDLIEAVAGLIAPTNFVEQEKLWLRTEIGHITQACGLEIRFRALGDGAGIALVGLAVCGFDHVADQDQGWLFDERINEGAACVRAQQHVGGFDAFPACNGGTIESLAFVKLIFAELGNRDGDVLPLATGIGEAEVNKLDFVVFHHLHHVCDGLGHQKSPRDDYGFGNRTGGVMQKPCQRTMPWCAIHPDIVHAGRCPEAGCIA